jgi:hypothetical protein
VWLYSKREHRNRKAEGYRFTARKQSSSLTVAVVGMHQWEQIYTCRSPLIQLSCGRSTSHILNTASGSCPSVFAAGFQCVTLAFGDEPCRVLRIIQRFGEHIAVAIFKRPTITHSPWIWQPQCLSKRWIIFNIRRGSSPKAEVTQRMVLCSSVLWYFQFSSFTFLVLCGTS